jgi:outer membrane receptor protein involved in Fe transport
LNLSIPRFALWAAFCVALTLGAPARAEGPELLHSPRREIQAGHPLVVDGTLLGTSVDRLTLHYRSPGESWRDVQMELQYGDLYRATVPGAQVTPPEIEYFIDGSGFSGQHYNLFRTAAKPAKVEVIGEAPTPATRPPVVAARPPVVATNPTPGPQRPVPPPSIPPRTPRPPAPDAPLAHAPSPSPEQHPWLSPAVPGPTTHPEPRRAEGPVFHHRSAFEEDLAVYSAAPPDALPSEVTQGQGPRTNTLVFEREQIRALGARSVFDVLDVVPGLTTSRDVQGNWQVAVRGLRAAPEVLFLLNGHRLNNFWDGKALANLPVDNLDRIEVTLGPGVAANGADAFEGVVNLVTNREDGVRATVAGGSFKTLDGHLTAATHSGQLQFFVDADVLRQDGYSLSVQQDALDQETVAQGLREPGDPAGTTNDRRAFANVGAGLSYGDARANAGLSLRFLREDRGALIGLFDTVGPSSNLGWNVLMADATFERWFSERLTFSARAYADLQNTDRNFQLSPTGFNAGAPDDDTRSFPNGLFEHFIAKTRTMGLDGRARIQLGEGNHLSVGVQAESASLTDFSQELNFDAGDHPVPFHKPDGFLYPEEAVPAATSRLTLGTFAQDVWTLGRAVQLDFAFRLDAVQLPTAQDPTQSSLVASFNPRAGISYAPTKGLLLHLNYARAFRAPTVEEYALQTPDTFFTHGQYEGNAALVPATVDSLELGGELTQAVEGARVHIRGSVFFQNFTHEIAAVDTSGNIVPLHNREGVRVWGAEGSARVELSRRASAWANASFFRAVDTETPDDFQLLTDTPQARFNAGLTLPLGPYLNFDVYAQIGSERRNLSRTVLEQIRRYSIPAYSLVTAQLRTERIADHFELALVGHNVFDVQRFDDVPRPDRVPGLLPREGLWASLILTASY